jgi:superfamily I DNA/RNA helicase
MSWWLDITDLDDDQKNIISLPPDGKYLILGPPGSGKTNLLLIRAEYLIRTNQPNLLVLMFNDPLHDFVSRGGAHYNVPYQKIRKMLSFELVLLRENGVSVNDIEDEELTDKRKILAERVLALLASNPKLEQHLQCLLVDEVQDCIPEEIEVFFRCAKNVCFAGDSGQRIFGAYDVIPDLEKRVKVERLKTHYRIGHEICRVADVVGKAAGIDAVAGHCNYKGPESKVHFIPCASNDEQVEKIIASLEIQLTAFPGELLGAC